MTQIILLLVTAMQLLTNVQNNPALPQSFRDSAISVANYAIEVAQKAIKEQYTPTSTQIIKQVEPLGTPIIQDERTTLEKQRTTIEKDLRITASCSGSVISCTISVRYLENNQGINGIPIKLLNIEETKISSVDGTAQFGVSMKKYGNVTKGVRINAESNGVTKTIILD